MLKNMKSRSELTSRPFLLSEPILNLSNRDRLIALIWWYSENDINQVEFNELNKDFVNAGYAKLNVTIETRKLANDWRIIKDGSAFRLNPRSNSELVKKYGDLVDRQDPDRSTSIFDDEYSNSFPNYLRRVVVRINGAYDHRLYDCCLVIIRRLIETLIIEIYESQGRASEIQDTSGHFLMLSGLLSHLKKDDHNNIGRRSEKALEHYKVMSDTAAHNRRFNAKKSHITDQLVDLRIAIDELRQMAGFN